MSTPLFRLSSSLVVPSALLSATAVLTYFLLNRLSAPLDLPETIVSPRALLPSLTEEQVAALPYPPTFFPGSRWVKTPHGTILVFEFGPENGRKVVLVHGISTPCCVFRDLVWSLVEEGRCRVIVFDLYGRGWSDTPLMISFDHRLFSIQIVYALLSSSLPWLSPETSFDILGYSLGGSLIPAFLATLPASRRPNISSIILLAPAGLLPYQKMSMAIRLGYRGYLPTALQTFVARRRMRKPGAGEWGGDNTNRSNQLDINAVAGWQASNHQGFMLAWLGSFRSCPIYDAHEIWREMRQMLDNGELGAKNNEMGRQTVLVVLGEKDDAVKVSEVLPELNSVLGSEEDGHMKVVILENSGHDFVATRGRDVANHILDFWGMNGKEKSFESGEDVTGSWIQA